MSARYADLCAAIAGEPLPAMVVDLDAFDANLARVDAVVTKSGLRLRLASKSLRVPALIERVLQRAGSAQGIMCFSVREACYLASQGFDDLLVAYPTLQPSDLRAAATAAARGPRLHLITDCSEGIDAIAEAVRAVASHAAAHPNEQATPLNVMLDIDMSLHLSERIHLGVRRSPLREPAQVVALARHIEAQPGLSFGGLLAYEAQVAGLQDAVPYERLMRAPKAAIRRLSIGRVAARRAELVAALERAGLPPRIVNGGGTGSLDSTCREAAVSEVTAGSAFFKPQLFDYYRDGTVTALEPACYFAVEVCRRPGPELVTCLGGGYVASGALSRDKIPEPWLPRGLSLLDAEMAGEVQTPLRLAPGNTLDLGAPVFFRHAKAGELSERFETALLIRGRRLIDRVPTYRGLGQCFL